VVLLARLALDRADQGQGIGSVFHAIRPPNPRSSGQWFHDYPAT
jgi:hypothetical protein